MTTKIAEKKSKAGQPPKYRTEEALRDKIEEYFDLCRQSKDLPEKAGLCLYLGITRETLSQYRNHKYPDAVKSADLYIESCWVRRLNHQAAVGAIFYLKNAFKEEYKDKQDSDVSQLPIINVINFNDYNPAQLRSPIKTVPVESVTESGPVQIANYSS